MAEPEPAETNLLKQAIEQLYENERLTDALTDAAAGRLLGWGEQQLQRLADRLPAPADLDAAAHQLQQVMRTINRLVEQHAEMEEVDLVQNLLQLVEQAAQLPLQPDATDQEISLNEQVLNDDQEEQKQ